MANPHIRIYENIWTEIKSSGKAVIHIEHPAFANRIKRGVIMLKYKDKTFVIANDHTKYRLVIRYDKVSMLMEFRLETVTEFLI